MWLINCIIWFILLLWKLHIIADYIWKLLRTASVNSEPYYLVVGIETSVKGMHERRSFIYCKPYVNSQGETGFWSGLCPWNVLPTQKNTAFNSRSLPNLAQAWWPSCISRLRPLYKYKIQVHGRRAQCFRLTANFRSWLCTDCLSSKRMSFGDSCTRWLQRPLTFQLLGQPIKDKDKSFLKLVYGCYL